MAIFPLAIFPQGSLSSSVITTVWLGVLVVCFFNLRLGWVLSGLVVPGYLVPLLIVKPWAAAVVISEGIVTYLLVWFVSEVLSRRGWWSPFFGRDRFFALILSSILVRIVFDMVLLPQLGEAFNRIFQQQFDYRYNLHSFGLIIVALIANQFWKSGLRRGLIPFVTVLFVTFALVRFGLVEWTNFSLSNLGYLYEDVAFSILASPKSYIILVTAAFIASRMNLHYGWDFNGILIPALLALQWYQPAKILTSFVEAGIVLLLATLVMRMPLLQQASIEGARKLLLFFNVSFAYKMALGYLLLWQFPELKVTDYYGFGYLLPTLMAVRMHDREIIARLIRATLQTSLTAVALASLLGFALTFVPEFWTPAALPAAESAPPLTRSPELRLVEVLQKKKIAFYQGRSGNGFSAPGLAEMESFRRGLRILRDYRQGGAEAELEEARRWLQGANYQLSLLQGRYLFLQEIPPRRGWGVFALDLQASNELLLEIPAPLEEWGTMEGGGWLFTALSARALAIAGAPRQASVDGAADVLRQPQSLFQVFHQELGRNNALQLRGYTAESIRALGGARRGAQDVELAEPSSMLWVKGSLPPGLDLVTLEELSGGYRVAWGETPLENLQRASSAGGYAELRLNRLGLRQLLFRGSLVGRPVQVQQERLRIDGYLQEWLLSGKAQLAPRGSGRYVVPRQEDLLYLDEEVITPLLRLARTEYRNGDWSETGLEELRAVATAATILGYEVLRYHHIGSGHDYLLLSETASGGERRSWGTYVLRLGPAQDYVIQIPRPLFEVNSFEYAVSLFENLQARALLIGGTHPEANLDGSADLVQEANKRSLFTLFSQVLVREAQDDPMLLVQTRAFGQGEGKSTSQADVLVAFDSGVQTTGVYSPLGRALLDTLETDQLRLERVDGAPQTQGYEVGNTFQARQLTAAHNKEFVMLWLSPSTRAAYRQQSDNHWQQVSFSALGIPSPERDLPAWILQGARWGDGSSVPAALQAVLAQYLESQDIVSLRRLLVEWPKYRYQRALDLNSRQAFLLVCGPDDRLLLVVNLAPRQPGQRYRLAAGPSAAQTLEAFIATRAGWLEMGGER